MICERSVRVGLREMATMLALIEHKLPFFKEVLRKNEREKKGKQPSAPVWDWRAIGWAIGNESVHVVQRRAEGTLWV